MPEHESDRCIQRRLSSSLAALCGGCLDGLDGYQEMSCECQQQKGVDAAGYGIDLMQMHALAQDQNALYWYVQGVRTGMQIRAAEQTKWTRLGVIVALAFGTITFMKHINTGEWE
jgi:hypothetical protein